MTEERTRLLREDAALVREALESAGSYRFSEDLRTRMAAAGLSSAALARRCSATHTAVDKWCRGTARPNGKERMKLLGMALEMDEEALNRFLFRNGYPRLYVKNPLDCAAKRLLHSRGGRADNAVLYEEILERLKLSGFATSPADRKGSSGAMSQELRGAVEEPEFSRWLERHRDDFRADERRLRMDGEMTAFLRLYLGEASVHELVSTGQLSAPLKSTLYEILSGRPVLVRTLREKLIALGWQLNLTDEELDTLLTLARLRGVTEAETRLERVQLIALGLAHEHYPGYELANLEQVSRRLKGLKSAQLSRIVREHVENRLPEVRSLMNYYERRSGARERCFERHYTAWSDHSMADYLRDLLRVLEAEGTLARGEAEPLLRNLGGAQTEENEP